MTLPFEHPPRDQWESLVLSYLDGSLCDADFSRVEALVNEEDFQRLLADYAIDYAVLHETGGHSSLIVPVTDRVLLSASAGSHRWATSRTWMRLAAALMIAASVALAAGILNSRQGSPEPISVVQVIGNVTVDDVSVDVGAHLNERTVVRTRGLTSFARLGFEDGTELRLNGDSAVACQHSDGQKVVRILSGQVSASVARQPLGQPLIIQTASASMEVLGTDLAVAALDDKTRLNVATGSVKMHSQNDGEELTVNRGQFAVAADGVLLAVNQLHHAPHEWKVDFSQRLPKDWERGEYVPPLPAAPRGAIRAEYDRNDGYYTIIAPNAWSDGHFRIEEDTYLNFRIKMDRPEWYQVILCVRNDMFSAPNGHPYHEYQEAIDFNQISPGEWRTVSVPLSAFRLTQRESVEPFLERPVIAPPPGSTAFLFLFSTQTKDRGLEIEKIWVTRGRPAEESAGSTAAATTNASTYAARGTAEVNR